MLQRTIADPRHCYLGFIQGFKCRHLDFRFLRVLGEFDAVLKFLVIWLFPCVQRSIADPRQCHRVILYRAEDL